MVNEIFVFVRSPPAERTLHGGDTYQFSFLLLFESIIYRLLSLRPFAGNLTMFSDCYPSRTLANYATPDKEPETACDTPISVLRALLPKTTLVGSYPFIFDNTFSSILTRHGLVVVRLSNNLSMYYFYFHHAINVELNVSISNCRAGLASFIACRVLPASDTSYPAFVTVPSDR